MRREYDADMRVRSATDDGGGRYSFAYGAGGKLASVEHATSSGHRTTIEISPDQRSVRVDDTRGQTTEYKLSGAGLVDEILRNGHRVVSYQRDAQGRVVEADHGPAGREAVAYDRDGRVTRLTRSTANSRDAGNDYVEVSYDADGRLARLASPDIGVVEYRRTTDGVTVLRNGAMLQVRTDKAGRSDAVLGPDGTLQRVEYSSDGQVQRISVDRSGRTASAKFTEGRLTSTQDALGGEFRFVYDASGRLASATDPVGIGAAYEYDAQDRLSKVTLPDGRCVSYEYDAGKAQVTRERIGRCPG